MTDSFPFTIVAIDGGAASGKSSTARTVADRLNLLHVDTGAHYRAITHQALQAGVDPRSESSVRNFLNPSLLTTEVSGHRALVRINGYLPHETELRDEAVNRNVSLFAALPAVRMFLFSYQRGTAETARARGFAGLIMEGRDIGSVIFPQADFKFYLEADPAVRAARRQAEGQTDSVTARDAIDSSRAASPLTCPDDAVAIDTGALSLPEVVALVCAIVRREIAPPPPGIRVRKSPPIPPSPKSHE